jgi:predicted NBD/HSP70 family sugar kinase
MRSGLNNYEIQKTNRSLILRLLLETGSITRAELAQKTGLKKPTITNIVNELLNLGIIAEDGIAQTDFGRPGELIRLNVTGIYIISMAITRKNYRINLFDLHGTIVREILSEISIERDIKLTFEEIKEQIQKLIDQYGETNILGMALGMPGPYIRNNMDMAFVTGFEQLSKINVSKELKKAFNIPLFDEHDVKLSAYAEWKNKSRYSDIPNPSLVVLSSVGLGIGAGIVINGSIVQGALGIAGEIGHMGINLYGNRMEFGNIGSFEQYAGTEAAYNYMLCRLHEFPDTKLSAESTYKDIVRAYYDGDALAVWTMEKIAWMLGYGIVNIIYFLNPDIIIIEADYPSCDAFFGKIREMVKSNVHPLIYESVSIRPSNLKRDSVLWGGYYLTLEKFLAKQELLESIRGIIEKRK